MTRYTNKELAEAFVKGETVGRSNRMGISQFEDWTLLWGYDHALYAARHTPTESLFVYVGWNGYSVTTTQHLNNITSAAKSKYGEPRDGGVLLTFTVNRPGNLNVSEDSKHPGLYVTPDTQPRKRYGRLDTKGVSELSELADRTVPSQSGYGD